MSQLPVSKQEFKKHVGAIHTSGELSLLERKLSNVLLLHAYDNLLAKRTHTLPVGILCAFLGYDSKDVQGLKRALKALVSTTIEFNLMQDGKEKWAVMSMLSFADIRDGICTWRYDEYLAERLFDPEIYSVINVSMQRQFQSSNTLTLYENCLRYKNVGSTGWWDIDRFRKLMGATSEAYVEFRRLNEKVIQPAIKEINRTSDIQVRSEFERKGRGGKVSAVKFSIEDPPQQVLFKPELVDDAGNLREREAFKMLRAVGVSERLALATVQQDETWALSIAKLTQGKVTKGQVKNPGAYAAKLIREGATVEEPEIVKEQAARVKKEESEKRTVELREKYKREFETERKRKTMASLSKEQRCKLLAEYVEVETKRGNSRMVAGADLKEGYIMGMGATMFEIFVTRKLLGDYTDKELDQYIAARLKPANIKEKE